MFDTIVSNWPSTMPAITSVFPASSTMSVEKFQLHVFDEVSARISKVRITLANLRHLLPQKGISLNLKGRVCQATVRAVLLYGFSTADASETWLVFDGVSVLVTRLLENGYLVELQLFQSGKTSSITE
ncbi:hypothetical protein T265_14745, partial [Opisthorchis viverrini]